MNAYLPIDLQACLPAVAAALAVLPTGWLIAARAGRGRSWPVAAAWGLVILGGTAVGRLSADQPPGLRMILLIAALLWGMKAVVMAVHRAAGGWALPLPAAAAWWLGWPGMRPAAFASLGGPPRPDAARVAAGGLLCLTAGLLLIVGARVVLTTTGSPWAATVPLLVGLSFALHFGLIDVAAGLWRRCGADARPLFHSPLSSAGPTEFWSRRWNVAFSEMTALAVVRPATARLGPAGGLMAGFLVSGLLHEAAISVPAGAGFGGPTAYFLLHGGLVLWERNGGPTGTAWTAFWVIAPLPMLFHPPFLSKVVWPIILG